MPRGGPRPGSGRKAGAQNKNTEAKRVIAEHAVSMSLAVPPDIAAMSPLQVMLRAMSIEAGKNNWGVAAEHAAKAAPYVHPRLTNVEMNATVRRSPTDYSDAELAALAGDDGEAERGEGDPEAIFGPH